MQAAKAWEPEYGPYAMAGDSRVVVTWPRSPRLLVTLLRGDALDVSRAGAPSPFAILRDVRGGS